MIKLVSKTTLFETKKLKLYGQMIAEHLIIGFIGFLWGSGMIYFARTENIPAIVKPFLFSSWIKSDRINRALAVLLGTGTVICSILFIIGGLSGRKILPFP